MTDDEGFIGLPPGMTPNPDSGTVRRERAERARSRRDDVVFFPAAPGAPVAPPTSVAPEQQPAVATPSSLDEATIVRPRRATSGWRLVIAGRDPVRIDGTVFLGRNPVATAGREPSLTVSVDDEAKSVSKTHAMLEVVDGVLWVHDLDSTNGVWIVPPGHEAIEVIAGQRAMVPAGADIELGDFVIQVEHG